jgi:hypothetical protein
MLSIGLNLWPLPPIMETAAGELKIAQVATNNQTNMLSTSNLVTNSRGSSVVELVIGRWSIRAPLVPAASNLRRLNR